MSRTPRAIEDARIIDAESEDVQHQIDQDNADEAALASELGLADGDTFYTFTVHKHVPNSKQLDYCMEGTLADLPLTPKLQENWGAGKYKVQVQKNGKFASRYTISVAAPPLFKRVKENPQPVTGNDPKLYELLDKLLVKVDTPAPVKSGMSTTEIVALIAAAAPLIETVKKIFTPPPQPNPLEMLKVAVELVGDVRGGSEREPTMFETIARVITNPEVMGTIQSIIPAGQQVTQQPARPQLPQPTNQPPTPEQIQATQTAQIKQQLAYLVTRAQKGSEPALYADVIIDTYPPEIVQQFANPGAIEFVIALHPPCGNYRPWFNELLTEIVAALEETTGQGEAEPAHNPQAGASPVSASSPASRVVFDPERERGDENDFTPNGETGEGW